MPLILLIIKIYIKILISKVYKLTMKILAIQNKMGIGDTVIYLPFIKAISKKFFNLKSNKEKSTFLYAKVDIKDGNSNEIEYFSNLQDLNFLIKNILKISNEESLEIISQSIPEKNPILYKETILKIL